MQQKFDKKYIQLYNYIDNSFTGNLIYLAKMWINSLFHRIVLLTKQFDKWLMLGPVLDSAYFGEGSFGLGAEIQVFNSPWWTERKNGKTQARTGLGICYLQGKGKSFTTSVSSRCDVLSTFD